MQDYKREEYKVFELFDKKWALVTAGNIQHYNCCTVSWGSLGNICCLLYTSPSSRDCS